MKTKIVFLIVFNWVNWGVGHSQAIFAPVVGAEWNYYFISTNYDEPPVPLTKAEYGIINYKYLKDTIVNSIICKKIEVKETTKIKGDNTVYITTFTPLIMMQRNDSVFTFINEKFMLSYSYLKELNTQVVVQPTAFQGDVKLKLSDTSMYSSINQPVFSFKKFSFNVSTGVIDADLINPLAICDRIGPINSDLTHIRSQGRTPTSGGRKYRLNCYKDDRVGELKFVNSDCLLLTKMQEVNTNTNLTINFRKPLLEINMVNNEHQDLIKNIILVDINGKILRSINNLNGFSATINLSELPLGLYIAQVQTVNNAHILKKIVNY